METRKHIHEEEFSVSAEKMFEILHKTSAICVWWGASRAIVLPEENGIWTADWGEDEDNPDYIRSFVIKEFESCLLYTSPSPRDQRGSRMPSSA